MTRKRVTLSIKEVVADLKAGLGDDALMEKYGLSVKALAKLKNELQDRNLIGAADLKPANPTASRRNKALNAKEFVRDFRNNPNDEYLMERYGLTLHQLLVVYKRLMEKHLLSEFEYYLRETATPADGEENIPPPQSASALVAALETSRQFTAFTEGEPQAQPEEAKEEKKDEFPTGIYTDFSGVKIGPGPPVEAEDLNPDSLSNSSFRSVYRESTVVQLLPREFCPNCARPREDSSATSCEYCGIVFVKAQKRDRIRNVVIWPDEE